MFMWTDASWQTSRAARDISPNIVQAWDSWTLGVTRVISSIACHFQSHELLVVVSCKKQSSDRCRTDCFCRNWRRRGVASLALFESFGWYELSDIVSATSTRAWNILFLGSKMALLSCGATELKIFAEDYCRFPTSTRAFCTKGPRRSETCRLVQPFRCLFYQILLDSILSNEDRHFPFRTRT